MKRTVPKKSFMRKAKRNKNEAFETNFHLGINSKALFGLSDGALKLYIFLILNGSKRMPSAKMFAARAKKSERTISRLYQELKDKGFLKIICVRPKVYQYIFDFEGKINFKKKKENHGLDTALYTDQVVSELIEKEDILMTEEAKETIKEIKEYKINPLIEKAQMIKEYEDFAILENKFWTLNQKQKEEIISIIESRYKNETDIRFVLDWFLEKVKNV